MLQTIWLFIYKTLVPYIKEHARAFWIGFTGSGVVWGGFLFADPPRVPGPVAAYVIKLLGAACIAFVSGLATSAATDFYKKLKPFASSTGNKMRNRIKEIFNHINSKNDGKQKDDKSEAA